MKGDRFDMKMSLNRELEIALAGAYAMLTEQGTTFVRGGDGKTV